MKVITGKVRLSYANLLKPASINGSEPKYSVSILIDKEDNETLDKVKKAIKAVYNENKSSKLKNKAIDAIKIPLRDGDNERPDDENYQGKFFINANSTVKPGIVDKSLDPIIEEEEVYSGMFARVSVNFFAYNTSGNIGIGCGLNNVMKLEDGERLGGKPKASEDFADFAEDFADSEEEDFPF